MKKYSWYQIRFGVSNTAFEKEVLNGIEEANHPNTVWLSHETVMKNREERMAELQRLNSES
jgi:hypothetical protein